MTGQMTRPEAPRKNMTVPKGRSYRGVASHGPAGIADPEGTFPCCMGTYWVLLQGAKRILPVVVVGEQVVSGLCEAIVTKIGPQSVAAGGAFLQLFLVAPPAEEPSQEEAEAAAIPSNLMNKGSAALVEGAYYLAVDTRSVPAAGGEFPGFPLDSPHPTPHGWS